MHTRRPVALVEENFENWLKPSRERWAADNLLAMTVPESEFSLTEVGEEVNSTRNDGPQLLTERKPQFSQATFSL